MTCLFSPPRFFCLRFFCLGLIQKIQMPPFVTIVPLSPSSKVRNIYPPLCSPLVSILRGSNGELRYPFHFENVASCHLLPPSALPSFVSEPRPTVFLMTSFNSDSPLSELSLRRRCRLRRANTCPRPTRDQSSCNGTRQSALGSRDC